MPAMKQAKPGQAAPCMLAAAVALAFIAWLPAPALAQQPETTAESHDDDHHIHANHLGVLIGASTPKKSKSETSFALGVDYERRLNDLFGVGALVDFVFGDFKRNALAGAAFFVHPVGDLTLLAAPGAEWVEKETLDARAAPKHEERGPIFVIRLGVSYPFHIGNGSIAPMFNVDFIGESKTTFVYGVSFGYGF